MPHLHPTVEQALGGIRSAIGELSLHLSVSRRQLPALSLPLTQANSGPGFLLVGRVLSLPDGAVVISHGRGQYCHVLFAPPLPVQFRAALVYCSDYRAVHSRNHETILEVLSAHVKVLQECNYYIFPPEQPLYSLTFFADWRRQWGAAPGLAAFVIAKSPVMGTGKSAKFMLEISSERKDASPSKAIAAFILFKGADAICWWPFLHVGNYIAFVSLQLASLPQFSNRYALKVEDTNVRIFNLCPTNVVTRELSSNPTPSTSSSLRNLYGDTPARKRMRFERPVSLTAKPSTVSRSIAHTPFYCSHRTIIYEGVITESLSDGRLRLDDAVYLHLGGDYSWCTGGAKAFACFRVGTRIEALNVTIAFQRGIPTTLFPTSKTNINVLYFGNLPEDGMISRRTWQHSPWFRYWSLLPASLILWAQELYDKLSKKFKFLLESTQPTAGVNECDLLVDQMLGSRHEPGLVEFLMEKLTGNERLFKRKQPRTHLYSNFLGCTGQAADINLQICDCKYQYPAAISELSKAVDIKWLSSRSNRESVWASIHRVRTEVFSAADLSEVLLKRSRNSGASTFRTGSNVVLIGMLEGSDSSVATARISDATGSVFAEFFGTLDPALLGAVVIIEDFRVVVECISGCTERNSTFVFDVNEVQVLIDGPCVQYDPDKTERPATQTGFCERSRNSRLQLSQNSFATQSISQDDIAIDEFPLAAIFIYEVSSISRSDGQPQFRISGRLLAYCKKRKLARWTLLNKNGTFLNCFMAVRGVASTCIRASLEEGQLYGIGCSDFQDCDDIDALCKLREEQSVTVPPSVALLTESAQNGLWVQKLQLARSGLSENSSCSIGANSPEFLKAVRSLKGLFQSWKSQSFLEVTSTDWRSDDNQAELSKFRDESLVPLSGTLIQCNDLRGLGHFRESEDALANANYSIILRESNTSLVCIHIVFHIGDPIPRGLFPGCSVQLVNVKPRTCQSGQLIFTVCEMTRITLLDFREGLRRQPSFCCHRPVLGNPNGMKLFPRALLWDFCSAASHSSSEHKSINMFGIVRVNIMELRRIEFFPIPHVSGCDICERLDGVGGCVGARAVAVIEDGTTYGELECFSFAVVMELLRAREDDSKKIRSELPDQNRTQNHWRNWAIRPASAVSAQDDVLISLKRLAGSMRRSVQVLVRNQCTKKASDFTKNASMIDEGSVRGHNFGFGRKLWTTEHSKHHKVRLEALAIFDEGFWVASNTHQLTAREIHNLVDVT